VGDLARPLPPREAPDDGDRRYWLETLSDEELADMAWFMFGHRPDREHIRCERERLLGRLPVTYLRRGVGRSESGRTSWPHASQRVAP
jgi:hypothetical protein